MRLRLACAGPAATPRDRCQHLSVSGRISDTVRDPARRLTSAALPATPSTSTPMTRVRCSPRPVIWSNQLLARRGMHRTPYDEARNMSPTSVWVPLPELDPAQLWPEASELVADRRIRSERRLGQDGYPTQAPSPQIDPRISIVTCAALYPFPGLSSNETICLRTRVFPSNVSVIVGCRVRA